MELPVWFWVLFVYVIIAFLLGELYLWGTKKIGREPQKLAYYLGMAVWPLAILIGIFGPKPKKENDDG